MAYPRKWSPINCRLSTVQQKHAGEGPTFYRWTMQPTKRGEGRNKKLCNGDYGVIFDDDDDYEDDDDNC